MARINNGYLGVDKRTVFDGVISLNKHYTANIFVGVLDLISDVPAFAYSTRRLTKNYSGPLTRAWNTVNNAEGDVYPDTTNWITASSTVIITTVGTSGYSLGQAVAFSTFCSTNLSYHKAFYDQTGNDRHLNTWFPGANPPRAYNSGTMDTINGRCALKGTGSNALKGAVGSRSITTLSSFIVTQKGTTGSGNYQRTLSCGISTNQDYGLATSWNINNAGGTTQIAIERNGQYAAQTAANNTAYVISALFDGSNEYIRLNNNTAVSNTSTGTFTFTNATILGANAGGEYNTGSVGEWIVYDSLVDSTKRALIERNQGAAWGITVA